MSADDERSASDHLEDPPAAEGWRFTVPETDAGERLDRFLAARLEASRNQIRRWVDLGRVTVAGRPAKASRSLDAGVEVVCRPPESDGTTRLEPEEGPLVVLHQDDDLIVVDKPAGLAVHPGAGRATGTLAHRLLHHDPGLAGVGGPGRPGIVHRLDLDTTGVLVVARRPAAYQALVDAFSERRVDKRYLALVYGIPRPAEGSIDQPIGRHRGDRKKMTVHAGGRPALTHYRVRETGEGIALLEIDLATGRTHQIRVHLKHLGHPLVGDPVYGEARWRAYPKDRQTPFRTFPRPALHAWRLAFEHPTSGQPMRFEAAVPADLRTLWRRVAGQDWPL